MKNRISYTTIIAAKAGDSEALKAVLKHYAPYITVHSKRTFYDEFGNCREVVDEDIRQRIEAKLLYQIIEKFDPTRCPPGQVLDR